MAQTSLIQIAIQLLVFMHLDLSSVYLWWNPIEIILNTYLDQTHKLADGIYIYKYFVYYLLCHFGFFTVEYIGRNIIFLSYSK